jgi:hypothetical protein
MYDADLGEIPRNRIFLGEGEMHFLIGFAVALSAVILTSEVNADNLDVSVVTIKKFTVLGNGGVNIPAGEDSYWDFLEITNNDNSRRSAIITGIKVGLGDGCLLSGETRFPISLSYKTTLEFTIRQGCGVAFVVIDLDGGLGGPPAIHQQRYSNVGTLMRLASPVFQAHFQRSN